jgi:two-component system, LytTR family, sensor kinase
MKFTKHHINQLWLADSSESSFWKKAFRIYILAEVAYWVIYYFTFYFHDCKSCLSPPIHYVSLCILSIFSTAFVWSLLYRFSSRSIAATILFNIFLFIIHQVLWFFLFYGLVKTEALLLNRTIEFSGDKFMDAVNTQAYNTWYDTGKYVIKVAVFYSLKYYDDFKRAKKKKTELLLLNMDLQLNLLKQQINPHFYFNTLNNLYGLARNNSEKLYSAFNQLSAIMHYVLKECNDELVSLEKEVTFLKSYIALEKMRYEKNTVIEFEVSGNAGGKKIPSLLLIQFVENAFKHGMKEKTEENWMKVRMSIKENMLTFVLQNSCYSNSLPEGIGLSSSRRRLELLYKERHSLVIGSLANVFTVDLVIELT